jgi:hypothetical protein
MAAAVIAASLNMQKSSVQVEPFDDSAESNGIPPSSPAPPTEEEKRTELLAEWSVEQVARWLYQRGHHQLAAASTKAQVDGATLIEMDAAAWHELGVESALERAKMLAAVKKASAEVVRPAALAPGVAHQDWAGGKTGKKTAASVKKHFTSGCAPRNPEGGAEHTRGWSLSICNANRNPGEVKQHFLRFLGMYNVIDLLVFTIDATYLMTMELSGKGPDSWAGVVILTLVGLGAVGSGVGMVGSTILYNTASAVSDANFVVFAKTPSVINHLKFVNDFSIFSGNFTCFATFFLLYRVCVDHVQSSWYMYPGAEVTAGHWYYALPALVLPPLWMIKGFPQFAGGIFVGTHYVMYGGLMSGDPIQPLADDPTWAHRSSPEEISAHLARTAFRVGAPKKPKACETAAADWYAEQTVASIVGDDGDSPIAGAGEVASAAEPLLRAMTSIISLNVGVARRGGKASRPMLGGEM